jgi:hypothetical protein
MPASASVSAISSWLLDARVLINCGYEARGVKEPAGDETGLTDTDADVDDDDDEPAAVGFLAGCAAKKEASLLIPAPPAVEVVFEVVFELVAEVVFEVVADSAE